MRGYSTLLFALIAAACGARSSLPGDGDAGGGGTFAGPTSTIGATSSTGSGGAGLVCPALAWVGEPVAVPFSGGARAPELVRVSDDDWAVVFEGGTGDGRVVASFAVDAPFTSWPPVIGPADAHLPAPQRFAATEGDPGMVAFALSGLGADAVLAQSAPGQNGSALVVWPALAGATAFASRSPFGRFLVGRYHPEARGVSLSVEHVAAFEPNPVVSAVGFDVCAVDHVPADVVLAPTGGWLVASAGQTANQVQCAEAVGLAGYLQVSRVAENGIVLSTDASIEMLPLDEVLLARRPDGAFLGYREAGSTTLTVIPVADDGAMDFASPSHLVGDEFAAAARHALTGVSGTWAAAALVPNDAIPGGSLTLHVEVDFAIVSALHDAAVFPMGEPTLAASDDGASFLVAFEDSTGAVGLRRADCVLP